MSAERGSMDSLRSDDDARDRAGGGNSSLLLP